MARTQTVVRDPNFASVHVVALETLPCYTDVKALVDAATAQLEQYPKHPNDPNKPRDDPDHLGAFYDWMRGDLVEEQLTNEMKGRTNVQRGDFVQLTAGNTHTEGNGGLFPWTGERVVVPVCDMFNDGDALCWAPNEFKFPEFPPLYFYGPNGFKNESGEITVRVDIPKFIDQLETNVDWKSDDGKGVIFSWFTCAGETYHIYDEEIVSVEKKDEQTRLFIKLIKQTTDWDEYGSDVNQLFRVRDKNTFANMYPPSIYADDDRTNVVKST
jgi:hypothetical protein